jgi:hypothetical protein
MPVVSEESAKRRGRNLWPLWVAVSVPVLLLVGVALLPLTGYTGSFCNVGVWFDCGTDLHVQGYLHERYSGSDLHLLRIGSWHWMMRVWH